MIQRLDLDRASPWCTRGLSVDYGRGARAEDAALWDANLRVAPGAMTAIVGPNGAGKTTLLGASVGLVPALAGQASFWGQPFKNVRERVAYLPQRESVDWDFPVVCLDVAAMGAVRGNDWWIPRWARRGSAQREEQRAREALTRTGMEDFADCPIGELSGGQQQRVFMARALAQDADLLLLDEPFAAVDAATEGVLLAELRREVRRGKAVVCVHHDLHTIEERFDEAVLVNRTVVAAGPSAEVVRSPAFEDLFGHTEPAGTAASVR